MFLHCAVLRPNALRAYEGQRMPKITARMFGGFELRDVGGEELTLGTRKARALLAFLIIESGQWHPRERLAGMFWGDRAQTQARNSLN